MRTIGKYQFLVLLALAQRSRQPTDIRFAIRSITNYQVWLRRSSVHAVLHELLAAKLVEEDPNVLLSLENPRPGRAYKITVLGRDRLHKEVLLQRSLLRWARRQLDEP
jgi:hypothetical protein